MSSLLRLRLLGLLLAAVIFAVDQWLKDLVVNRWGLDRVGEQIVLLPFFNLTRTNNYGVSLGMLTANSTEARWLLVAGTSLIAAVVFVWLLRERRGWDIFGLALILGGAIGNIRDRYLYGYVIDFADLHIGGFRPFLIFNLADAAISIGVVIILARALFMSEKPATAHDANKADTPAETN